MERKKVNQKTKTGKIKVLHIIHGYPPYYMAGSEVYTQNLCKELSKSLDITVFSRIENEYLKPYEIIETPDNSIKIIRVNKPGRDYTFRSKYIDEKLAKIFEKYLEKIKPDVVHIGHLSHLTTLIVRIVKKHGIPIIFTLHDYWMICVRGQLICDDSSLCSGPDLQKCAKCNRKYFTSQIEARSEIERWLKEFSEVNDQIDLFIAPSKFLREKYIEYGIPEHKIVYMDYGFNTELFKNFKKKPSEKIRFGFLGRIIPVKGIALLIDAFNEIDHSKAELNIFGNLPSPYLYLKERCINSGIHFKDGFDNRDIAKVFSEIDVLIVPSMWYENSPLVIHEAFLAKVLIITSNLGGMAELVQDGKNGLLFEPGNVQDLIRKINRFIEEPDLITKLTQKPTPVRTIQQDANEIVNLYYKLLNKKEVKNIVCQF